MTIKTKHIHWTQLKPFVERYPDKIFTLFYFSQRYSNDEIAEFFTPLKISDGTK